MYALVPEWQSIWLTICSIRHLSRPWLWLKISQIDLSVLIGKIKWYSYFIWCYVHCGLSGLLCCTCGKFCCGFAVVAYLFLFRLEELGVKEVMQYVKCRNIRKMYTVSWVLILLLLFQFFIFKLGSWISVIN